jgi:type IX secretion system PorP/SprF family membrane protein
MRLIIILLLFGVVGLRAQQTGQYSMFNLNPYAFNPAFGGMEGVVSITGIYRTQWVGMSENPVYRHVNAHTPFYRLSGGLGISIDNAEAGAHRHNSLKFSYNYVKVFNKGFILSGGLAAGFKQRSLDGRKLRAPNGNYDGGQIDHNDPRLPVGLESGFAPDMDFGIFAVAGNFEGGISVQQILGNNIQLNSEFPGGFAMRRTFNLHTAYTFYLQEDYALEPALLMKYDQSQLQTDLMLNVKYRNNLSGGLSLRGYSSNSIDAIVLFGGVKISQNFFLGYAYDITLSTLRLNSRGSHEILLRYDLDRPLGEGIREKIIHSPRL